MKTPLLIKLACLNLLFAACASENENQAGSKEVDAVVQNSCYNSFVGRDTISMMLNVSEDFFEI